MSVICSMQAGQPVATTCAVGFSDVFLLAFAYGRRGLIVLEIETAAATAAPVGLGHLFQYIVGVGLKEGPGLGRHPQRFFQVAGVVIGDGNFAILRTWDRGRNPHLIHQKLADIQGSGRQGGDLFLLFRGGILHHQRPELLDGGTTGGAGRDQIVAGGGWIIQKFQVEADQVLEGLGIAAGEGRNAAAALAGGEIDPHSVVIQDREAPHPPPGGRSCR